MSHVDKELKTLKSHSNILKKGGKKIHFFLSKQTLFLEAHDHEWGVGGPSHFKTGGCRPKATQQSWLLKWIRAPDEPGGTSCPRPWALAATPFETGRSQTFLSESLFGCKPFASSLLSKVFNESRGDCGKWILFLSFLQSAWITPVCHPLRPPQAQAGFLPRGSSPCPPWWAEAP